ncbi:sialidase-1 [Ereboglobus sp. PH5-10]|uniref:sialidase family protein n=1 Tax=Ereboglobus sp. PH5-10 TaxID=2940629 RepID=UPI002405DA5C|nr:sialidase family protein [Ereboglobus sp. PH5-10]MDF9826575.1 sialidase-1 [Ereboglobus sp. PH5-10]
MKTHRTLVIILLTLACATLAHAKNIEPRFSRREAPVLTLAQNNTALEIRLNNEHPCTVEKIAINLDGTTDLNDIASVRIHYAGRDKKSHPFGETRAPVAGEMVFAGSQAAGVPPGVFKISIRLKPSADLLNRINVSCAWMQIDGKRIAGAAMPAPGLRVGVAVRQAGDDGVARFRIPGIVTTPKGTLLAIYDVRREKSRDLQGDIDIGLSRSTDGGQNWEPMRIVLDMGEWGGLPQRYNGVSDACILVDDRTGDVYVAGLWMHGLLDAEGRWIEGLSENSTEWTHQWRAKSSQPGFGVKQTSQFLLAKSTDDGRTWSPPKNLTRALKKEEWWLFAPAPGRGIMLKDGTLVMPAQGRDEKGLAFSNIVLSRDAGKTWSASHPAYSGSNENQIVQLDDGSIMLNSRRGRDQGSRAVTVTHDLGKTWREHPSSGALVEPGCMAALHRHEYTAPDGSRKSILLFANPNSKKAREKMTIKVSFDNGATWPARHWILLNEEKRSAYSCLTSVDEQTIGILYEAGAANMVFQKIPLAEILNR